MSLSSYQRLILSDWMEHIKRVFNSIEKNWNVRNFRVFPLDSGFKVIYVAHFDEPLLYEDVL